MRGFDSCYSCLLIKNHFWPWDFRKSLKRSLNRKNKNTTLKNKKVVLELSKLLLEKKKILTTFKRTRSKLFKKNKNTNFFDLLKNTKKKKLLLVKEKKFLLKLLGLKSKRVRMTTSWKTSSLVFYKKLIIVNNSHIIYFKFKINNMWIIDNSFYYSSLYVNSFYFNQFYSYKFKFINLLSQINQFKTLITDLPTSNIKLKTVTNFIPEMFRFILKRAFYRPFYTEQKKVLKRINTFQTTTWLPPFSWTKPSNLHSISRLSGMNHLRGFLWEKNTFQLTSIPSFVSAIVFGALRESIYLKPVTYVKPFTIKTITQPKRRFFFNQKKVFSSIKKKKTIKNNYWYNSLLRELVFKKTWQKFKKSSHHPSTKHIFKLNSFFNPPVLILKQADSSRVNFFRQNIYLIKHFIASNLLIKYFFLLTTQNREFSLSSITTLLNNYHFTSQTQAFQNTNLIPINEFNFRLQKKVLQMFNKNRYRTTTISWHINTLIRFMEHCSGKPIFLKTRSTIEWFLSYRDQAYMHIWHNKLGAFRRMLGPNVFVYDGLRVTWLALKLKDTEFFSNWIRKMCNRIKFYKFRVLFRFLKFLLKNFFWVNFHDLKIIGVKFKLKGKITVSGNSRTRKLVYAIGKTGHSTFLNRVSYDLSTISTFTGVLGFQVWIFF